MPNLITLRTSRLLLRPWCEADRQPFAQLNADPIVMEHFPGTLSRSESDAMVDRIQAGFGERGWGLWAVEVQNRHSKDERQPPNRDEVGPPGARNAPGPPGQGFVGYVGLTIPRFEAHFSPCVEVGWRLAKRAWGHGFATEAARASLQFGFEVLNLDQIVSMTAVSNVRSQRVMQRLGMVHDASDDFDHPLLPADHRLSRHVLFRIIHPSNERSNRRGIFA